MNILSILEGIISSVPEAVQLYHKVAPLIAPRADISDHDRDAINQLTPIAHNAVTNAHAAIEALVNTHTST